GMLHRDKRVWGEDAEEFNPDHFSAENQAKIPPNAYKPFGTGQRACIGRQFALQEATLVLGMLLQRFELVDYANYQLETQQTLTVKPHDFHIKVKLRAGRSAWVPVAGAASAAGPIPAAQASPAAPAAAAQAAPAAQSPAGPAGPTVDAHQTPLLVLYGSNLRTAEGLAHFHRH